MSILLIVSLITWIGIAVFSAIEAAFNSLNRVKIEMESKRGVLSSRLLNHFYHQRPIFNYVQVVGQLLFLIFLSISSSLLLNTWFTDFWLYTGFWIGLFAKILIITLFYLITGIMIPALVAKSNPTLTVSIFVYPFFFFYILFYPLARVLSLLSASWLRKSNPASAHETEEELLQKIDIQFLKIDSDQAKKSEESVDSEIRIFQNALEFPEVKLHACMIPRTEIKAVEENESISNLTQLFIDTGLSRILIYKKDIDNIVGYFKSTDLFKKPASIRSGLTTLPFVPESMAASQLLEFFIKEKKNIAVVVDEFGGTAGIITIEDIIEEIFGDIEDEHDINRLPEEKISAEEFIFSGRLEIDYINEAYELEIPESDEYHTINGFILKYHPSIPKVGEVVEIEEFLITILEVSSKRIELINLRIIKKS
jgi:CBS domain containing-hemolysin-like protein